MLKTIERTVVLEAWTNRIGMQALREIENEYRRMLEIMVAYAVEHKASQSTLHEAFYNRFRKGYSWLPTRIIKGCYRDAARRAKSFRELQERGAAKTSKPEVRRVTITLSDSQDWKLEEGVIKVRTYKGWILLHYRNHKQLHRYLYSGWKLSEELRLKLVSGKLLAYLTFKKDFEAECNSSNVVAVDVNENNVTLAVFKDKKLSEVYRVETNLGKIVISYSERRRRITEGRSTKDRDVKKDLKKLREKERKHDIVRKTAKIIEEIASKNNAAVVVGGVFKGKKKLEGKTYNDKLRHRIHQWSVSKLMEILNNKPLSVVTVNEAYTSTTDPFTRRRIRDFSPSVIRIALRGTRRVRAVEFRLRIAGNGLDRDVIGAVNIGLKYLNSNGRCMAFTSTEPHGVRLKLVIPHRGLTPLTELKCLKIPKSIVRGETLRSDHIDLMQVHWPPVWNNIPTCEYMRALEKLVSMGLIDYIGVSNFPPSLLDEANECLSREEIVSEQVRYNLIEREAEKEIIPYTLAYGMTLIAWSPLAKGALTGKYTPDNLPRFNDVRSAEPVFLQQNFREIYPVVEKLKEIGAKYSKTPGQVSLNWLLSSYDNVVVIPGAKSPEQVSENVGASGWRLNFDDWKELDELSRRVVIYRSLKAL